MQQTRDGSPPGSSRRSGHEKLQRRIWSALTVALALDLAGCAGARSVEERGKGRSVQPFAPRLEAEVPIECCGSGEPTDPDVPDILAAADTPRASANYVFSLNPGAGTVAVVHAESLDIQIVQAGDFPTFLRTSQSEDVALVLNVGSNDATLIHVDDAGEASTETFDVVDGANAVALAPDGRHAIVYYDAERATPGELFGNFQSVSVISLAADVPTSNTISVGFKPTRVFFQADSSRGFVVTETGISTLDFSQIDAGGSGIAPAIPFSDGGLGHAVWLTPDGAYALVHELSTSRLKRVSMADGSEAAIDVSEFFPLPDGESQAEREFLLARRITDLDVREDATEMLATVGGMDALLRIPVPGGFDDLTTVDRVLVTGHDIEKAEPIGRSSRVLAYRSSNNSELISVVDFAQPDDVVRVRLKKGIARILLTEDGTAGVIEHLAKSGDPGAPGLDVEARIDRAQGFSMLRTDGALSTKLEITEVPLASAVVVPGTPYAFLLFRDDGMPVREVLRIDLDEFVVDPPIQLDSAPLSAGVVPGVGRVFVHQQHPDGRLTFVDWDSAAIETVTGFDLNSRIRD